MKRILSLVLVLVLVLGSMPLAFADEDMTAGEYLKANGLLDGDEEGNLMEDKALTRAEMTKMVLTLKGLEEEAAGYALPSNFSDVDEAMWYSPYIAYAELMGLVDGMGDGTFAPTSELTREEAAAFLLKAVGKYGEWADVLADAEAEGIVDDAEGDFVRANAFDMMKDTLAVVPADAEVSVGADLGLEDFAVEEEPEVTEVAISSAVALNSKVVEVALDGDLDAPEMVDASLFTVTDEDDAELAIESAEFAGWDADMYTVLVTLEEDLTAGEAYTVASGDTSEAFGGLAADTTKPAIDDANSSDYNKVKVTMTEAFDIADVMVTITEKYGDQDELAVLDMEYSGSDTLLVTTSEQADSTLYEVEVDGLADLAGNSADDLTATFTGQSMDTDDQTVVDADGKDSVTVDVEFRTKVDEATALDAANYTITEKYGDQDEVVVTAVEFFDADADGDIDADDKDHVRLTLATDTEDATLYELEVENVGTLYGEDLDTANDTATFTGAGPDTDEPSDVSASADNNTEITITVTDVSDIDADSVTVGMFSIAEKYGDKDELAVIAVKEVDVDGPTITLTTAEQTGATLYEVTVAEGLADKFGNATTDELTATFTGADVADEITSVTAYNTADGKVLVEFNENYGDGALSVVNYNIDGDIGYPTKVETVDHADYSQIADADAESMFVLLSVSELTVGDVYTLTVENVKNSDGVAMDEDGLTDKFSALYGDSDTSITLEAVVAVNDQELKLYFSSDVADLVNVETTGALTGNEFTYDLEGGASGNALTGYAYEDPTNSKVLLVTSTTADVFDNANGDELTLDVEEAVVTNINTTDDADLVGFAENTTAAAEINIDGIVALDDQTLKVYFDQAVRGLDTTYTDGNGAVEGFAYVNVETAGFANADDLEIIDAYANNDAMTEWILVLEGPMTDAMANKLDLVVVDAAKVDTTDYGASIVDFDDDPTSNATIEFSKNTDSVDYITDVGVTMLDSKTLKVYFPEEMDWESATGDDVSVLDADLYDIAKDSDGTGAPAQGGDESNITKIEWKDSDNSAIITLDTAVDSDVSKQYLVIDTAMANRAGNKTIATSSSDNTDLIVEYSVSTAGAADVAVSKVAADAEADTVTITLDQPINLGDGNLINNSGDDYADAQAFAGEFTIKIDGSAIDYNDISSVVVTNEDNSSETTYAATDEDSAEIVVTFVDGVVLGGKDVDVSVSDSETAPELTGLYNDEDLADDSDAVNSVAADTTAPEVANALNQTNHLNTIIVDLTSNGDLFVGSTKVNVAADQAGNLTASGTYNGTAATVTFEADYSSTGTVTIVLENSAAANDGETYILDFAQIADEAGNSVVNDTTAAETVLTITSNGGATQWEAAWSN